MTQMFSERVDHNLLLFAPALKFHLFGRLDSLLAFQIANSPNGQEQGPNTVIVCEFRKIELWVGVYKIEWTQ